MLGRLDCHYRETRLPPAGTSGGKGSSNSKKEFVLVSEKRARRPLLFEMSKKKKVSTEFTPGKTRALEYCITSTWSPLPCFKSLSHAPFDKITIMDDVLCSASNGMIDLYDLQTGQSLRMHGVDGEGEVWDIKTDNDLFYVLWANSMSVMSKDGQLVKRVKTLGDERIVDFSHMDICEKKLYIVCEGNIKVFSLPNLDSCNMIKTGTQDFSPTTLFTSPQSQSSFFYVDGYRFGKMILQDEKIQFLEQDGSYSHDMLLNGTTLYRTTGRGRTLWIHDFDLNPLAYLSLPIDQFKYGCRGLALRDNHLWVSSLNRIHLLRGRRAPFDPPFSDVSDRCNDDLQNEFYSLQSS